MPGLPLGKAGEYLTDKLTDAAMAFIDSAGQRPFFLLPAHHAPHTPIEAPAGVVEHFQAKLRPEMKHQNATYAAMVKSLDENVGRVLDHSESRGLEKNTIVVFTSDNGGYHRRRSQRGLQDCPVPTTPAALGQGLALRRGHSRAAVGPLARDEGRRAVATGRDKRLVLHAAVGGTSGNADAGEATDGLNLSAIVRDSDATLSRELSSGIIRITTKRQRRWPP